jgi:type VI secretion system protein ImpA
MTATPLAPPSAPAAAPPEAANDLTRLLAPLDGDARAGASFRYEPLYDEVKAMRVEDDPSLPQGIWQRELKKADWGGVARTCVDALATKTKDLQLAAWLTEAWVHLRGFAGLADGVRLMTGYVNDYWDDVHPTVAESDLEGRLAPIGWAMDKLALPVKRVHVTAPTGEDAVAYGWKDWEAGLYVANIGKKDAAAAAKAEERGMVSHPRFLVSVSLTPAAWFANLAGELAAVTSALDDLDRALIDKAGEAHAPSVTPLRSIVVAIQAFVSRVLDERREKGELPMTALEAAPFPDALPEAVEAAHDDGAQPQQGAAPQQAAAMVPARITSRNDAYHRLNEAAEYLMRTEPHSPVPYLVKRAVAWGNMSLADLLTELLAKNADLATVYALLGIKKPG